MFEVDKLDNLINNLMDSISADLGSAIQEDTDEMTKALAELLTARALYEI